MIEAAFSLAIKNACQLEGSDHGGRDSAAELALAGTIDVQASDSSCNRLTLGPASSDGKNYTPRRNSVNEIFKPRNYRSSLTLISAIPILPFPQSRDGQVAQLVERGPEKAGVGGSIPSLATTTFKNLAMMKKCANFSMTFMVGRESQIQSAAL